MNPYAPGNWSANCYIYENQGTWVIDENDDAQFTTQWGVVDLSDGKLMEKGKTYSMLLPYCTKCEDKLSDRKYWDYWSGKFLIFESTDTPVNGHEIDGSTVVDIDNMSANGLGLDEGEAIVTGNTTFANLSTLNFGLYTYAADLKHSTFYEIEIEFNEDDQKYIPAAIQPTESFLVMNYVAPLGLYVKGVQQTGELIYGNRNNGTTDIPSVPTIKNSSMYVTAIPSGINVAVSTPQYVRVVAASGYVVFSGMVQDNVDVLLPMDGIYVVAGEYDVQKVMLK